MTAIRVIARIRPPHADEMHQDVIVTSTSTSTSTTSTSTSTSATAPGSGFGSASALPTATEESKKGSKEGGAAVRIPSAKKEGEEYVFEFSGVYGAEATQQEVFEREGSFRFVLDFFFQGGGGFGKRV